MISHSLTDEQRAIIAALPHHKSIKVYALAGTGKTTTLKAIAQAYPKAKMLYLAFNKAIADEAKSKFPPNVEVRTVHSLAFSRVGRLYGDRLSRLDYYEIAKVLGVPIRLVFEQIGHFQNFLNSDCPLDRAAIAVFVSGQGFGKQADRIADFILRVFYALKTSNLKIDHNFYLKDFQLNFKTCGLAGAYDAILLDEGQDVNPVILSIFNQFRARKIMVGDRHQKIYGFRGAINAIENFAADQTLYLTRTFRFHGKEQVSAVNELLYYMKGEDNLLRPVKTDLAGDCRTICTITRTNARLIEILLESPGIKTVRHPGQYFEQFFRIFDQKIRVSDVDLDFRDYLDRLEELAERAMDMEIAACVKLIRRYGCDREFFQNLYEKALKNFHNGSNKYLGTAHSTKGLEFDTVKMADDFRSPRELLEQLFRDDPSLYRKYWDNCEEMVVLPRLELREVFSEMNDDLLKEEINLLYVGMTRAKEKIGIPWKYRIAPEYEIEVPKKLKDYNYIG